MEPIGTVTALPALAARADASPRGPEARQADGATASTPLDPAADISLSPEAGGSLRGEPDRRGYERDTDTRSLVYRVTDAVTGDVVIQIPNEVVLKARAYARDPGPPPGERIETFA